MKNLIFVAFFALLQSVSPGAWAGANQWTNIGLNKLDIESLQISPTNPPKLYATTFSGGGGMYMNTIGEGSWTRAQNVVSPFPALLGQVGSSLAIDPSNPSRLYAAGFDHLYKSADAGLSWNILATPWFFDLVALSISPSNPNVLYTTYFTSTNVSESLDGGLTWNKTNGIGLPHDSDSHFDAFLVDPFNPAILYASITTSNHPGFTTTLYQSLDSGASWSAVSAIGLPSGKVQALLIAPTKPATLYAATGINGLYKSIDGGGHWTMAKRGLPTLWLFVKTLVVDSTNPLTLYAVISGADSFLDAVYKSTDGGERWTLLRHTGLPDGLYIYGLVVDPANPNILYAGTDDGVYTFTDLDSQANAPAECVMNWVESKYAGLFAPAGSLSTTAGGYLFRSYAASRSYLGVSATNNHLVYQGADGVLQDGGPLKDWLPRSNCETAANLPSSDCLFNWAEANYPGQFAPAGSPTEVSAAFTSRNYAATKAKLGVSATNNHLYYQGADGSLLDEGPLSKWLPLAGCQ